MKLRNLRKKPITLPSNVINAKKDVCPCRPNGNVDLLSMFEKLVALRDEYK